MSDDLTGREIPFLRARGPVAIYTDRSCPIYEMRRMCLPQSYLLDVQYSLLMESALCGMSVSCDCPLAESSAGILLHSVYR